MENQKKQIFEKRMNWHTLALMVFSGVWGFGNVINGFSTYHGLKAILPWLIIFGLYFVPYALMVGELGSAFKNEGGGVSSWIAATISPRMAYYAGWTYWIVHMPYISQKPGAVMIASSWAIFQDNRISSLHPMVMQLSCLAIFVVTILLARRGLSILKKLAALAGMAVFVMSILYIILMVAAPAITSAEVYTIKFNADTFMPTFDARFFMSFSILVLAVGGCEKISPYVNKLKDPAKDFPRGMIVMVIMVAVCAVLGTISMGMMFDSNNIPEDLMTNGAYYAFEKLGAYYGVGQFFVIAYAITNFLAQLSVLIMSIDAPLCILLASADEAFVPKSFFKQNKYGAYINGHKLVFIIVSILIIIPAFGIGSVDQLVKWLVKVNAVCMPLRYLWVFVAYIALKKVAEKFPAQYHLTKSKKFGKFLGMWCFALTAFACITGIYSEDIFEFVLNICTPLILLLLGFLLPIFAKKEKEQ